MRGEFSMQIFKKSWLFMVIAVLSLVLAGCMAGSSDNTNNKDEGDKEVNNTTDNEAGDDGDLGERVVVYSPHGTDILSEFQTQFEEEYGIKMEFLDMGSQEILDRVRSEKNNTQADIWWGAPQVNFNQAKDEGLLAEYKPSYADSLDSIYHDEDWMWSGTSMTPQVIMYNKKEISDEDAPKEWDELLDPKWADDIIIRYPLASGGMRTIFSAIIFDTFKEDGDPQAGYDWLAKLDANTKEYSANPEIMYNQVAKGVGSLSIWNMPDTVQLAEEKDYPFGYNIPTSGTPVITEGIAVLENAPNPKGAEAFYEFVNSPEATKLLAEEFYRIPTRNDVTDLPDWITETEINPMEIDWEIFEENSDEWMEYWDNNIKGKEKHQEE